MVFRIYAPGIAQPHEVLADAEQSAVADALYAWGLRALPEGTVVTSEPTGDAPCSSAT